MLFAEIYSDIDQLNADLEKKTFSDNPTKTLLASISVSYNTKVNKTITLSDDWAKYKYIMIVRGNIELVIFTCPTPIWSMQKCCEIGYQGEGYYYIVIDEITHTSLQLVANQTISSVGAIFKIYGVN